MPLSLLDYLARQLAELSPEQVARVMAKLNAIQTGQGEESV